MSNTREHCKTVSYDGFIADDECDPGKIWDTTVTQHKGIEAEFHHYQRIYGIFSPNQAKNKFLGQIRGQKRN